MKLQLIKPIFASLLTATFLALFTIPSSAIAVGISSEVRSDGLLPLSDLLFTDQTIFSDRDILLLEDGDFSVRQNVPGSEPWAFGDGIDEFTTWLFDFTQDTNFPHFSPSKELKSALLTIERNPMVNSAVDDDFFIQGLSLINVPSKTTFTPGNPEIFTVELLDFYNSEEILSAFITEDLSDTPLSKLCNQFSCASGSEYGQIAMQYRDDSVLSYAKLELTSVPEPSVILALFGLGAFILLKPAQKFSS